MQPTYLPWLGYFDLIAKSDIFVIYDHVQFDKRSWQQRNRVRNNNSELMLTVPVSTKGKYNQVISDVNIMYDSGFPDKHISSLKHCYTNAPYFDDIFSRLVTIYNVRPALLIDLNLSFIELGMRYFNITTQLVRSSTLNVKGNKVDALIDICKKLDAEAYYSPVGSKAYIDGSELFQSNNIELIYQDYVHPVYSQLDYPDFMSHLSFVDYLFNSKATLDF